MCFILKYKSWWEITARSVLLKSEVFKGESQKNWGPCNLEVTGNLSQELEMSVKTSCQFPLY